jgi:hypothetical protein
MRDMERIEWRDRDGLHVSYAEGRRAVNLLDMIEADPAMELISVG